MISPILRLNIDELASALDAIDPVEVLAEELVGRTAGGADRLPNRSGRLTPWHGVTPAGIPAVTSADLPAGTSAGVPAGDLVLLEDLGVGGGCVLPASALAVVRTAALAALAARTLVIPGVVTAAVLGSDFAAQSSLTLIARYLPGLSHVAVCPSDRRSGDEPGRPLEPRVIDRLDFAGVGWSVTAAVAQAVFGATLIVATTAGAPHLEIGQLPKGAVLINTTGEDLPDELVDAVDQIYVDDAALIEGNAHRYFARMHLAGPTNGSAWAAGQAGRRDRRVDADLAQVLTGAHAGRTHVDHILLVELLGARAPDVRLACALHRAAIELGLGVRLVE